MNNMYQLWIGKCQEYDPEGNLTIEYKFMEIFYDMTGRKKEEQYFRKDGKPDYRYVYIYDNSGLLIEKKMFLGKDIDYMRLHFSYSAGKVLSIVWLNSKGKMETCETFTYSEDGKTAFSIRENIGEWIHEYDDSGREIKLSGFTYSDVAKTETKYGYDENGHLLWMEQSHLNRCEVRFICEKDERQN